MLSPPMLGSLELLALRIVCTDLPEIKDNKRISDYVWVG